MSQPKSGSQKPVIEQIPGTDRFELKDRGDWFTQEGDRPPRTALQWERLLGTGNWEIVSANPAPLNERTPWERREPAEIDELPSSHFARWTGGLRVGPENVGRSIRARVAAGYGPSPGGEADSRVFCEWGSTDGDMSGRTVYSNVLVVKPWGETPKPDPTKVARESMIAIAANWESVQGRPTPLARISIARDILETDEATWLRIRSAIRANFG